jgi:penicillin amidase
MVPLKDDITEYMDFSKNPSAVNPEWNFVYSANNQAEAVDGFISWLLSSRRQS